MGTVNDGTNGSTLPQKVGDGNGTGASTTNSSAGAATSTGGRGRGRPAAKPKQGETSPRVVMVDVPSEDKKEEPKKKGRGRPPGTAKKKAAAKKKSAQMDSSQIKMLLLTTTAIFAARPGMEDFALTADEAEQISEPLSSILSKSEGIAGVAGEYADHIALLIACFTIFVPKFLMWKAKQPKKKEVKNNVIPKRELPEQRTAERETRKPSPRDVKRSGESDVKEFGATLHQFVDLGGY